MSNYLDPKNFPGQGGAEEQLLGASLDRILTAKMPRGLFPLLGDYRRILGDNRQRGQWEAVFAQLTVLFQCGRAVPVDGPMIGVTMAIRDCDYFRGAAQACGEDRSAVARIELLATAWNATFGDSGIWMGKTFEPVSEQTFLARSGGKGSGYQPATTRIGRNFFREPPHPTLLQSFGLPVLTPLWHLRPRPLTLKDWGFDSTPLAAHLAKERAIPYQMSGGIFLAQPGCSVVPEMRGKQVYQLNYRWPELSPPYPMSKLIDELVEIGEGIYLGQLVMATKNYRLGRGLGVEFDPLRPVGDYGYQNNGYFLMIDPAFAREAYGDEAFPELRPRPGEIGFEELGYARVPSSGVTAARSKAAGDGEYPGVSDWAHGWREDARLRAKFTTLCRGESPRGREDGEVSELLAPDESVLEMLRRIQAEISAATCFDDHLRHFEKLNRLFRCGVAPRVCGGLFQGQGRGYNVRFAAPEPRSWYGEDDPCTGFDYYHGATLNLHFGTADSFCARIEERIAAEAMVPGFLAGMLQHGSRGPALLNAIWATIGRYIFPWAGKSFERIGGRKLSMLLDESGDLALRYPERVETLRTHPASWPHYDLVLKNQNHYWPEPGRYADHLARGAWGRGMPEEDREFWRREAEEHWVFGSNLQDERILVADALFRGMDMNYHPPLASIQELANAGPSPFVRQGYIFLGVDGRESILAQNHGPRGKKEVFQFHYRYPMVGGAMPIGMCLDELVEIAPGLFLGQLIYATEPLLPFHSTTPPEQYRYQLFGYFLLLDNTWERHRLAIGLDVNTRAAG